VRLGIVNHLMKPSKYEPQVAYTSWLLKRAERAAGAALYDVLRDLGITPSQYGVMQALSRLEKASSAELARAVFVTPQAMTGLVTGLERQGYIKRKPLKSSRVIEARLTPLGRRVFDEATARVTKVDMRLTSLLTDDAVDGLQRALRNCVDAFEGTGKRPPEAPEEPF
jgi:DNA-binding MarR family transcriptional regulator